MEPCCQFCGATDPKWELRPLDIDCGGPEICSDCVKSFGAWRRAVVAPDERNEP